MAFPAPKEIPEPEEMLMVVAVRATEDKKLKRNQKDIGLLEMNLITIRLTLCF